MIDYNNHKTNNHERKQAHGKCSAKNEKSIPGAIKIDEKEVFDHLDTLVRQNERPLVSLIISFFTAQQNL